MHSKWKLWDIKENTFPRNGLVALSCYDQFAFNFAKDVVNQKFKVLFGNEITLDWIDANLRMMDLFGGADNFLIHFAENIPMDVLKVLTENEGLLVENRLVLLNFTKNGEKLKLFKKSDRMTTIEIQAPAFWEEIELLDFLLNKFDLYMDFQSKRFFCERIPFELGAYIDVLTQLKINTAGEPTQRDIEAHIAISKFDKFQMAELFGNKKMLPFYKKLIGLVDEEHDFFQFLYFMHSHMSKVHHKDYSLEKKKLSKYDKKIIQQQKIWNKVDSAKAVNYFNELLTMFKVDKKSLPSRIKRDYLRVRSL